MPAFSVSKSVVINAAPEAVFNSVRDFRQWPQWSPWLIAEPDCKLVYSDDGKSYTWDGKIIGAGQLAVTGEGSPNSIDYRLSFTRPFKSVNTSAFRFEPAGEGTKVTWEMEGSLPFFLFFMKKMMTAFVGSDYKRGLEMLKDKLETGSVPSVLSFPGVKPVEGFSYIGIRTQCGLDDIEAHMGPDMEKVEGWLRDNGVDRAGPAFSIYHKWDMVNARTDYTVGLPVANAPSPAPAGFTTGSIPACRAYQVHHTGPYRHLGNAWSAGMMHSRAKPRIFASDRSVPHFEIYANDAASTPENELLTVVHMPAK